MYNTSTEPVGMTGSCYEKMYWMVITLLLVVNTYSYAEAVTVNW